MKNFENWWKEESNKADGCDSRDKHYRWRERDVWAKDAWKAALEWVLNLDTAPENILQSDGTTAYDVRGKWSIAKGKIMRELGISPFYEKELKSE